MFEFFQFAVLSIVFLLGVVFINASAFKYLALWQNNMAMKLSNYKQMILDMGLQGKNYAEIAEAVNLKMNAVDKKIKPHHVRETITLWEKEAKYQSANIEKFVNIQAHQSGQVI